MKNIFKVNGKFKLLDLLINITIPLGGGVLAAYINKGSIGIYNSLSKPIFALPSIVFPIVWVILYILMGIAAYRIHLLGREGKNVSTGLFTYYIQLLLNLLWPIIFFPFRLYGLSLIELIILFIFIIVTFVNFIIKDKISGILLLPYVIWTAYAGALNYFIWLLNEA